MLSRYTNTFAALGFALLLPAALQCQTTSAPVVRFHTNFGDIDVNLLPDAAPQTVANFLNYVNKGAYNDSIIHRSVPGFVLQGGGFALQNNLPVAIPQDPPVQNEFKISNTRGTIAMAKLGDDPNSATNQWFFNLADNSSNLDSQNGGFTVFGRVANALSLSVMDRIVSGSTVYDLSSAQGFGSAFNQIPLVNFDGATIAPRNYVNVFTVSVILPKPAVSSGGVISASNFGAFNAVAPGSYIEIYGTNLAGTTRQWTDADFTNGAAPTTLDDVSVTIGGQAAYVYSISPTQVNVQVPQTLKAGGQASVVVTYKGQASSPASVAVNQVEPGLLAPPSFKVGDKQFVAAIHSKDNSFVSNGAIPNTANSPAVPGETLTFYGVGFGAVNPTTVLYAGQVAPSTATLAQNVQFTIGNVIAQVSYAGLAPGAVGLYQFNVVVPKGVASGDQPLKVTLGSSDLPQTLYLSVQ